MAQQGAYNGGEAAAQLTAQPAVPIQPVLRIALLPKACARVHDLAERARLAARLLHSRRQRHSCALLVRAVGIVVVRVVPVQRGVARTLRKAVVVGVVGCGIVAVVGGVEVVVCVLVFAFVAVRVVALQQCF